MKTIFVNLKSEVTAAKDAAEAKGLDVYRCRLECNCKPTSQTGREGLNCRNGILVIDLTGHILERVIRCKTCAKGGQL